MARSPQLRNNMVQSMKTVQNGCQSLRNTPSPGRQRKLIPKVQQKNNTECESILTTHIPISSDDETSAVHVDKLQSIRNRASAIRQLKKGNDGNEITLNHSIDTAAKAKPDIDQYAVLIQKTWRGFRTRNLAYTKYIPKKIEDNRVREYIAQLTSDMAATKIALESERKIQQLQMQAISALWKKIAHLPSASGNSNETIVSSEMKQFPGQSGDHPKLDNATDKDKPIQVLEQTCSVLQSQVRELQCSMNQVMTYMGVLCQNPPVLNKITTGCEISTQTEIIAVNTPQEDRSTFPFNIRLLRPSTLPLPTSQQTQTTADYNKTIHTQTVSSPVKETSVTSNSATQDNNNTTNVETNNSTLSNEA